MVQPFGESTGWSWTGILVFAKICCGNTYHPVIAISVVPGPGDNSSFLNARSLTLPRYCLGVGRSAHGFLIKPKTSQSSLHWSWRDSSRPFFKILWNIPKTHPIDTIPSRNRSPEPNFVIASTVQRRLPSDYPTAYNELRKPKSTIVKNWISIKRLLKHPVNHKKNRSLL